MNIHKKISGVLALIIFFSLSCENIPSERPSDRTWDLLKILLMIPGVSGKENQVADYVMENIPSRLNPQRDEMENVWFSVGEGKENLVFVAHTDEIGFIVEEITPEGMLKVGRRGGFIPKMYEGWPVAVYTETGSVTGVAVPRKDYLKRSSPAAAYRTEDMVIDLGVDSEQGVRNLGVDAGDQVTICKKITELSENIIAARGVDDRAGCAVLLSAMQQIDWSREREKKITFLWDVQEEIGLYGAAKMAQTLDADFVFPVDTFVSSAGPLDNRRFAYLPLGKGAVIRAVDSSNITPVQYARRVMDIARNRGIPFQTGNTRGGNDGSVFVPRGAVDIPLSWPGLYSHSFIEKIHREDLKALTELVVALVEEW